MLPTVIIVLLVMSLFGWLIGRTFESEVRSRANQEAEDQVERVLDGLQTVDDLSSQAVRSAMKVLAREGQQLGAPDIRGSATINGIVVPDLRLGGASQVGNFVLVDRVKELTGCTATLFVRRDASFVRVSTNVLKADGSRAIGTNLDPSGRAFAAIGAGGSFYGVVDILGTPYMTGYEPMRDKSGAPIGIWYVGVPLAVVADLGTRISGTKILDSGYIALLQPNGKVLFKPERVRAEEIQSRAEHADAAHWTVLSKPFEKWGYTLLAAYPETDIAGKLRRVQGLVAFCALLISIPVLLAEYLLIARLVIRPIRQLMTRMKSADLNTSLAEDRPDEIGVLAQHFDTFVSNIRETLLEASRTSAQVATASEEISVSSRDQAKGAELQKDQTTQVATAMQEMAATVHEVSENSNRAAAASQKAAEMAREGGKVVEETLSRMRTIANSVGDTARKVQELGKRSDEIGRISGVIEDIADQTNLLALNAAIEAARAGEQGRGFAVVADEVRKLAERTGAATKEISAMICGIQSETKTAVAAMEAGSREVESGVESTRRAGDSLQQIIQMSDKVGEMVTQIATAATQQAAATQEIDNNVDQIARIAASTESGAQQTAGALQDLAALALNLRQLVGQFRLSDGTEGTGRSRGSQVDRAVGSSVDFSRVKMAHRSWRLKLRSFLDGRENIDHKGLASHRDCELGKWIYASGMTAYGHLQEMQELETMHKDMHALVKHVVELKHAGKASEAEQEFSRVCEAADRVVGLITRVEAQVMAGSHAAGAGNRDAFNVRTLTTEGHFAGKN